MDDEAQALNDSHPPGVGFDTPIDLHGKPTGGSTVSEELAMGTVTVASQPMPTLIDHPPIGEMSNPILWDREPSGCAIREFSPTGVHDVDSRGR